MSFLYLKHVFSRRKRFLDNICMKLHHKTYLIKQRADKEYSSSLLLLWNSKLDISQSNDYGSSRLEFHNQCEIVMINRRRGSAAAMEITRKIPSLKKTDAKTFLTKTDFSNSMSRPWILQLCIIARRENTSPYESERSI